MLIIMRSNELSVNLTAESFCLFRVFTNHHLAIGHSAPMRAAIATNKPDKLLMKSSTTLNHLGCSASNLSPAPSAGDQNQPCGSQTLA